MRPKKRILLAACHEERASILKYVLETHSFVAVIAPDAAEAVAQLRAQPWDLLLCELPFHGLVALLDQARAAYTPSAVLTGALREAPPLLNADAMISKADAYPAILLDRLKVLTARKRGPRPQPKPVASCSPLTLAIQAAQKARLA